MSIGCSVVTTAMPLVSPADDVIADVDDLEADAAGDRRDDAGIAEIDLRLLDDAAIGGDGSRELADERGLGVPVLPGDRIHFQQLVVAAEQQPRILELRLVAGERALRLQQGRLEGPRIDDRERLAAPHDLAFLVEQLGDRAGDLRPHRHRRRRSHRAERLELNRQVGQRGLGRTDRRRLGEAAAASATAAAPTSCRAAAPAAGRGSLGRVGGAGQPDGKGDYREQPDQAREPADRASAPGEAPRLVVKDGSFRGWIGCRAGRGRGKLAAFGRGDIVWTYRDSPMFERGVYGRGRP